MKNLILLLEKEHSLDSNINVPSGKAVDVAYDPAEVPDILGDICEGSTFLLIDTGYLLSISGMNDEIQWICDLSSLQEDSPGNWFSVSFISELGSLVCLSHNGTIASVDPMTGEAECVGVFSEGISCGKWSPDEEILALFTYNAPGKQSAVLITMNVDFEVLNEVSVVQPKEGSEIRMAWRPDGTKIVVSSMCIDNEAEKDSYLLRYYDRDSLQMEYISREEDGSGRLVKNLLPDSLSWGGDHVSFISASIQQRSKKKMPTVVFFEPNGLRHREFQLRETFGTVSSTTVKDLTWNNESDILAVTIHVEDEDPLVSGSCIQLWHRCNYHWYMKYELFYPQQYVSQTSFDAEKPYRLTVALNSNNDEGQEHIKWNEYEFCWDLSTVAPGSLSCASVIDGHNLNSTPLGRAVVPPPMYASTIQMRYPINHLAHMPSFLLQKQLTSIKTVAALSNGDLTVLGENDSKKSSFVANYCPPTIVSEISNQRTTYDLSKLRQYVILDYNSDQQIINLLALTSHNNTDKVVELQLHLTSETYSIENTIILEGKALRMSHWTDATPGAIIELIDGSLFTYSLSTGSIEPLVSSEPLMEPCPWISSLFIDGIALVVGLSYRKRLFCNDILISGLASSFLVNADPYGVICFTTLGSNSQMCTIPVTVLLKHDPLAGLDDEANALIQGGEGYEPRAIERGATLVSIVYPPKPSIILQLPRGNLEAIYPRSLVIPHVMHLLYNQQYLEAVKMMRNQKIDMNLIVDWDPERFISSGDAYKFISDVCIDDFLNLFIANLRNDDVTVFKYPIPPWLLEANGFERKPWNEIDHGALLEKVGGNKVNLVCQTLRRAMLDKNYDEGKNQYLLPILSTFAKEDPPKLKEALQLIRENALSNSDTQKQKSSKKSPYLSESTQSSIQYLAFLANYELLYNTALGMYDLDFAKAVARNSQLDPKVYIPQLKRWAEIEPRVLAKYEIDLKLKQYESALRHLAQAGDAIEEGEKAEAHFERCFHLIQEHKLFNLGLKLFQSKNDLLRRIMIALGETLLEEKEGRTALSVFLAATPKDWERAQKAARMCRDWQTFFACFASSAPEKSESEYTEQLRKVAVEVAEDIGHGGPISDRRSNMKDASRILLEYACDVDGAVEKMILAESWSEARRIALLHGGTKQHTFVARILESAISYSQNCAYDLYERGDTFEKTNARYAIVLAIRREAKQKDIDEKGEEKEAEDEGSLFSLASGVSNMSFRSNMSSSSVGSVTSVSSVIKAGETSTFTLTEDASMKHNSAFNKLAGGNKKKRSREKRNKKKRGKSSKIRAGSQEELDSLVSTLKGCCVDQDYLQVIGETILFLSQMNNMDNAKKLFEAYMDLKERMEKSQQERKNTDTKKRQTEILEARKGGFYKDSMLVTLECEVDVNALCCPNLPKDTTKIFDYF